MGADQFGYSVSAKSGHFTRFVDSCSRFPGFWCPPFPFTPAQYQRERDSSTEFIPE